MSHGVPHGATVEITIGDQRDVWPRARVHVDKHAVVVGDEHGKIRAYPFVSMTRLGPGVINFVGPQEDFTLRPGPPEEPELDDDDIDYGSTDGTD